MNDAASPNESFGPLSAEDFDDFFQAIHGYPAYHWQRELIKTIDAGGWPDQLALPTGSGKTSVLDIGLFSLALAADLHPMRRMTATRLFFVVDRRIVVDAAAELARKLARSIREDHPEPLVRNVARRLNTLSRLDGRRATEEAEQPIVAAHTLRGGFYRTNEWARSATQPTIVTATVDQVGSRLLFRGYGINPAARSLQAALVGTDSLIFLDEAHIARAFAHTARAVSDYQRRDCDRLEQPIARPMQVVELSATLTPASGSSLELDGEPSIPAERQPHILTLDLNAEKQASKQSRLVKRYEASKPVRLSVADKAKGKRWSEAFVKDLTPRVEQHLRNGADSVAVVVNRIKTAIGLFEAFSAGKTKVDADVELMIGRMRPHDRDQIAKRLQDRLQTSNEATLGQRPIVVIATQCLEVGADLDFQRMISEAASVDALRQRFGRLNRSGEQPHCEGEIVIRADQHVDREKLDAIEESKSAANDPVYGDALSRTFDWLSQRTDQDETIDFGSQAMDRHWDAFVQASCEQPERARIPQLLAGSAERGVLLPAHLRMLAQTGIDPSVHPDPDVGIFLHGMTERRADVSVCWRSDVFTLADASGQQAKRREAEPHFESRVLADKSFVAAVTECPPTSAECMAVPIAAVKSFLLGQLGIDDSLADTSAKDDDAEPSSRSMDVRGVLYRGSDDSVVCRSVDQLRPGDTLVLPATAGGWNQFGFIPGTQAATSVDPKQLSTEEVLALIRIDIADQAWLAARWKPRLRLMPALRVLDSDLPKFLAQIRRGDIQDLPAEWLRKLIEKRIGEHDGVFERLRPLLSFGDTDPIRLGGKATPRLTERASGAGLLVSSDKRLPADQIHHLLSDELSGELDFVETTRAPRAIGLDVHGAAVSQRAGTIARAVGLSESLEASFRRFGWLHDLGKADPRFQTMLSGLPSRISWLTRKPLAKSGRADDSAAVRRRDRERAGLPDGFRHERASVAVCEAASMEGDPLTLYLIATHHGHARPWFPPIDDPTPPPIPWSSLKSLSLDSFNTAEHWDDADSAIRWAERFWDMQNRFGFWGAAWLEAIARLSDQQVSREEAESLANDSSPAVAKSSSPHSAPAGPPELKSVSLGGVDGGNTLAFLVALGTLSLVDSHCRAQQLPRPKLSWSVHDAAIRPELFVPESCASEDWLVNTLSTGLQNDFEGPRRWLDAGYRTGQRQWAKGSGKVNPNPDWMRWIADGLRRHYCKEVDADSLHCDWVAAIGSEVSQRRSSKDREIDYSHLYLTRGSGHQRMLEIVRAIRDQTETHHLREALFETWQYDDPGRGLALRYDAAEDRPYAMRWLDPSSDPIQTVRGANAIAFEAMVCFPTAVMNHSLVTTGFHRIPKKGTIWFWPLWAVPCSLDVVRSLLQLSLLRSEQESSPPRVSRAERQRRQRAIASFMRSLGIVAIYQSERKVNDKFFNFSPSIAVR